MFLSSQNSKCQDLPKFEFIGGEGVFCSCQNSKCQDLAKFSFPGEGGSIPNSRIGVLANLIKNFWKP